MKKIIKEFKNKYFFLSNFFPVKIKIDGVEYRSSEHYFQAMKFTDPIIQKHIINAPSASVAKKMAKKYNRREDWYEISLDVMEKALRTKFAIPELRDKLLATDNMYLQEGNRWNDTFWGVDLRTRRGKNHLGRLLIKIRSELKK
ncbi:MAG: NADAR family protein [Candidatus Thorarchaeota archaeon]